MRNALLRKAFPWIVGLVTPLVSALVLMGVQKLPESIVTIVDPYALTTGVMSLLVSVAMWGLAKWTKIPVVEWQKTLQSAGKYAGRKLDGEWDVETQAATVEAVNDPRVRLPVEKPVLKAKRVLQSKT